MVKIGRLIIALAVVCHNGDHDDSFAITEEDYEKDIEVIVEEQMEVKIGCDVEVNDDGIPSKTKVLGILPNEL